MKSVVCNDKLQKKQIAKIAIIEKYVSGATKAVTVTLKEVSEVRREYYRKHHRELPEMGLRDVTMFGTT